MINLAIIELVLDSVTKFLRKYNQPPSTNVLI